MVVVGCRHCVWSPTLCTSLAADGSVAMGCASECAVGRHVEVGVALLRVQLGAKPVATGGRVLVKQAHLILLVASVLRAEIARIVAERLHRLRRLAGSCLPLGALTQIVALIIVILCLHLNDHVVASYIVLSCLALICQVLFVHVDILWVVVVVVTCRPLVECCACRTTSQTLVDSIKIDIIAVIATVRTAIVE